MRNESRRRRVQYRNADLRNCQHSVLHLGTCVGRLAVRRSRPEFHLLRVRQLRAAVYHANRQGKRAKSSQALSLRPQFLIAAVEVEQGPPFSPRGVQRFSQYHYMIPSLYYLGYAALQRRQHIRQYGRSGLARTPRDTLKTVLAAASKTPR